MLFYDIPTCLALKFDRKTSFVDRFQYDLYIIQKVAYFLLDHCVCIVCSADAEPVDCRGGRCCCRRLPRHLSTFPSALHSPAQVLRAPKNYNKNTVFQKSDAKIQITITIYGISHQN